MNISGRSATLLALMLFAATALRPQGIPREVASLSLDSLLSVRISSAARTEQTISEAPSSVTIISSEDIDRYGYRTLDEVLTTVKGFYRSNDRNYAYIGTRGFSRPTDYTDRLLLMVNGHVMNDNFYGSAPVGTDLALELNGVDHIEIVRGPASALYGTGAMFAVINIVMKEGDQIDGIKAFGESGSFGRMKGGLSAGKEWESGLDATFVGSWTNVDGHDLFFPEYNSSATNNGWARGLDWDRYFSLYANGRYEDWSLTGYLSSRNKGIPTGAFGILFNDSRAHTLDEHKFLELQFSRNLASDKAISLKGYYHLYDYRGEYPYAVDSYEMTDGELWEGEAQFRWDTHPSNRLVAGAEFRHNTTANYRLWDLNATYFDANFPYDVFSIYLQDQLQVTRNVTVTFGVRRDQHSRNSVSATPRGAVVYYPFPQSTVKLLYGEGFRAPNMYEAYYQDPTAGYKLNPSLQPERIRTLEAVWEQRLSSHSYASISGFRYTLNDLIDTQIDAADSLKMFKNVERVEAYGAELDLVMRWPSGLEAYANYTYQDARDANTQQWLTNSPKHLAHLGISYPVCGFLNGAVEVQYESGRATVYGPSTGSFLVTNVNLRSRNLWQHVRGYLAIRNAFDIAYATPGGFEHKEMAITQDGRTYIGGLEVSF